MKLQDKIEIGMEVSASKLYYNDMDGGLFDSDIPRTGWTPDFYNSQQKTIAKIDDNCIAILKSNSNWCEVLDYGELVVTDAEVLDRYQGQGETDQMREWVEEEDEEQVRNVVLRNLGFDSDNSFYNVQDIAVGERGDPNHLEVSSMIHGDVVYQFELK